MADQSEANEAARQPVVLVVEDTTLLRRTTVEYLRLSGFEVIEAANAVEAVAVFSSGKAVDVVFSDVYLSAGMDGLMLARWLHRHHPEIPVMLTSGYGDPARQAATERAGNASFLSKPYRQADAVNRIRALLEAAGAELSLAHLAQYSLYLNNQGRVGERLADQFNTGIEPTLVDDGVSRIACREQYLETRPQLFTSSAS